VHGPPGLWGKGAAAGRATGDRGSGSGEGGGGGSGNSGVAVLSRVLPTYPPSARNQRIQGWVLVEITVSRTGAVSAAQVVDAQPKRLFDQAALDAIRRWKFKPAYRDGQSVEQRVRQRLHFRLN
jgi:periplasmic protein TonB